MNVPRLELAEVQVEVVVNHGTHYRGATYLTRLTDAVRNLLDRGYLRLTDPLAPAVSIVLPPGPPAPPPAPPPRRRIRAADTGTR